ncbi:hypothetical protein HP439_06735 [Sphingobacterium shayense]|uniref:hypothetical protein n=1 Tax=Sphingobacterium shayense TaxID=626343 RepID=UPI0015573AB1|nr:hypothetical protein [Sphingobacterium shayense]NQD70411.1 hypothetical protein [Sphingobacterium shayense]
MEHFTDERIRELIVSCLDNGNCINERELYSINPDKSEAIEVVRRLSKEISYDIEANLGDDGNLYLTT